MGRMVFSPFWMIMDVVSVPFGAYEGGPGVKSDVNGDNARQLSGRMGIN